MNEKMINMHPNCTKFASLLGGPNPWNIRSKMQQVPIVFEQCFDHFGHD